MMARYLESTDFGQEAGGYTRTAAVISDCGTYRYCLERWWDEHAPPCLFVMLNPSTADHEQDDPTIRRCVGFAKRWRFGGLLVCNLFGFRATNPKELERPDIDPIGPENDRFLATAATHAAMIVAAWGEGGILKHRGSTVLALLEAIGAQVHHLGQNASRQPKHPLYLRADTSPQLWLP